MLIALRSAQPITIDEVVSRNFLEGSITREFSIESQTHNLFWLTTDCLSVALL